MASVLLSTTLAGFIFLQILQTASATGDEFSYDRTFALVDAWKPEKRLPPSGSGCCKYPTSISWPGVSPVSPVPMPSAMETCVNLENQGTYFAVPITVGTSQPAQTFKVVADTGSDAVIVVDCVCAELGNCAQKETCFRGTNHSKTFSLRKDKEGNAQVITMSFGSGEIESVIATDEVTLGGTTATLNDSLLLMVAQALDFDGSSNFQGILGLGQPHEAYRHNRPKNSKDKASAAGENASIKSFLEAANIGSFSMCANMDSDGEVGKGALRLNDTPVSNALPSSGKFHWGLPLQGISVKGGKAVKSIVHGAMIPDSGTTLITGPEKSLMELFNATCEAWPLCSSASSHDEPKYTTFQKVLSNCSHPKHGFKLDTMPNITFTVGKGKHTKALVLTGYDYVVETLADKTKEVVAHLDGLSIKMDVPTGLQEKLCVPAFGTMPKETFSADESIWIMGTPLFYRYKVHYEFNGGESKHENRIAFTDITADAPCGSCGPPANPGLVEGGAMPTSEPRKRLLTGPVRAPLGYSHRPF